MTRRPHTERWAYRLLYTPWVFEVTSRHLRFFGRRVYVAVARAVASVYAATQPGVRETVRENLALLAPGRGTRRDAGRVFASFGESIADYVIAGGLPADEALGWCDERTGIEHLEEARAAGRGAVLATGHFSFFEYGALVTCRLGFPTTVVTASEPSRELTEWRAAFRRRWGAETVEIGEDPFSALRVVRILEAGAFAAMLVDRPKGGYARRCSLPGGEIPFSKSPALIAHLADCPVIPVVVRRKAGGTYRIVAAPCIWPRRLGGDRDASVDLATEAVAAALAEEFALAPEQWYHFVPLAE